MDNTVNIIIDGLKVQTTAGSTILQAARQAGIEIPTFCYIEKMTPFASCFMCVVRIKGGRANLVPSCATPVYEGMEVETQSDEIKRARKAALELMLSDHTGDCFGPCYSECPTGVDIPGFINELNKGDTNEAIRIIKDSLPIPGSLGRVCPAPCEGGCRRALVEEKISIMSLKRFAADEDMKKAEPYVHSFGSPTGKKIAVIGAGPAGISVAYFSKILGHDVDVFDSHPHPGGMLRYGIPAYRLPRHVIDFEVSILEKMGVRFNYNRTLGKDISLDELKKKYEAVFLGIGAQGATPMRVEGEDSPGVYSAIEFLGQVSAGETPPIGKKVMIVGGGNSAIDAARTAIRCGAQALVYYRRTREEMPAFDFEIEEAIADGVEFRYLSAPVKIIPSNGKLQVECIEMALGEPDASGRRRPVPKDGSEHTVEFDSVIAAIGQKVIGEFLADSGLKLSKWGTIEVNNETMMTNIEGIFSGGDAVLGPDIAVRASGMGRLAAISINQYLKGLAVTGNRKLFEVTMGPLQNIQKAVYEKYAEAPRQKVTHMDPGQAVKSFDEVSFGFTAQQVKEETDRCMKCGCRAADSCKLRKFSEVYESDSKTYAGDNERSVFIDDSHPDILIESHKCITCGNCVRVCEDDRKCYALAFVNRGFETIIRPPMKKLLIQTQCDGCGKCVDVCPTGALSYKKARVATDIIREIT